MSTSGQATKSSVAGSRRGPGGERSMVPAAEPRSYYGEPVLARPVWTPEIAWYFWVGGIGGAAAPLATLAARRGNEPLARRAALVALGAGVISPVLLISDLGRPSRFFNMLRMFKVTSPMSVGSWILSAYGPAAGFIAGREVLGIFPRIGAAAHVGSLLLGPALSTYTAALIGNTAIPVWHEAHTDLPGVFAASSAASAGGLLAALTPESHAGPARRLGVAGAVAELALVQRMEQRLGPLAHPYHEGVPGRLAHGAKALTALGGVALAAGRRRPAARIGGGLALTAASALERWAIYKAGFVSADEPKDTIGPQRERLTDSDGKPTSYVRVTQHGPTPNHAVTSPGRVEVEEPDLPLPRA